MSYQYKLRYNKILLYLSELGACKNADNSHGVTGMFNITTGVRDCISFVHENTLLQLFTCKYVNSIYFTE